MQSKYLNRFLKLDQEQFPLRGSRILVELLPKEELKTSGGLYMGDAGSDHRNSTEVNKALLGIVLFVGGGSTDEDGNEIDVTLERGNVVLLSQFGIRPYSQFPGVTEYTKESIALTRESEVHCAWPSIESYLAYSKTLNA